MSFETPDHIPPDLIWPHSYDAFTLEGDDPFLAVSRLHDGPPLIWSPDASYGRPGWIATRFDVISEIFMDHERFSGERHGMIADLVGEPVRQTCGELIAKFGDKGGCDFIHDFAIPFPTYVFLDLMALPRGRADDFLKWEEDLMRAPNPMDRVAAARAIYVHLKAHKDAQRLAPANDLNRAITSGEFEGRALNHLEMMGMYYVLWVGGLDTVYSTLGWTMRHLATHPELQERLRADPSLIPQAVEEFARAFSVVTTHRQIAQDCEFHGVTLKAGEEIHLPLSLANRDPAIFPDPHMIDIDRKPRHIAFGFGPHNCLCVHLAKRELRIVIEEFLSHFSAIRLMGGEGYHYHTGRTFGVDYLPLELD